MQPLRSTALAILGLVAATPAVAAPFTFLQPGFTQELYGVATSFLGGVSFAPDGDVWSSECHDFSPLYRFDKQTTVNVNSTSIHPQVVGSPFSSNATCGMTNHPDFHIYANTFVGVLRLDADTGAQLAEPFGPAGNGLGIAVDPALPNDIYYVVNSDGTVHRVDETLTSTSLFSTVTTGDLIDGMSWDPAGNYLFLANRSPVFRLTILRKDGTLVQHVNMSSEPDGITFNSSQHFVVTNNTDGTMSRFDFPGNDFTQAPVQSLFASGGFRGDFSAVGTDGCIYLTQDGTRYDNNVVTGEDSVVRICGDFTPVSARRLTWGSVKGIYR